MKKEDYSFLKKGDLVMARGGSSGFATTEVAFKKWCPCTICRKSDDLFFFDMKNRFHQLVTSENSTKKTTIEDWI